MQTERKIRIAVLVSGSGSNLQALLDAQGSTLVSGEIVLVVANKEQAYGLERARKHQIKAVCLPNKTAPTADEYDLALVQLLQAHQIDLVVLAGWLRILGPRFLQVFAERVINIHPSLLPAFGGKDFYGLKVHQAALDRGVQVSGATVHYVEEAVDAGPIIWQEALRVQPDDTPQSLQQRILSQIEWKILPQATEVVAQKIARDSG